MTEQTFTLVTIRDNGRVHRSVKTMRRTWCGLWWTRPSKLVMLKGVGEIAADPNRFLCGRCFPPRLRRHAFEAHRDQTDPAALLREAGQAARDAGEALKPPAPARPTLGLPYYRLSYRDNFNQTHLVEKVLAYRYWNTGQCSVAVVAKEGGVADWGAYIGALPNRRQHWSHGANGYVSEEEVVAHVIREGNKLTWDEASVFFADRQVRGIGLRCGQAPLPMEAYRK